MIRRGAQSSSLCCIGKDTGQATMRTTKSWTCVILAAQTFRLTEGWIPAPIHSSSTRRSTSTNQRRTSSSPSDAGAASALRAGRSNIVLEPSFGQADAFDNLKIGNARVHRYEASGDTTEYVMWYHGRSTDLDAQNLPPLSTGRIGRAVSRNGLAWVKDTECSASEDVNDVSLGLNKESWWGFDTAHVGLGNVLLPLQTPAVASAEGVYLMYYFGGTYDESPVVDYMDNKAGDKGIAERMKDAKIQGMQMRIGVALSQDGISWGRVEGDDPTGSIVAPDAAELYCAWPEVIVDDKLKTDNFRMYYSTMTRDTKEKAIGYAVSSDGFRWEKKGICLRPSPSTETEESFDVRGCARCCVIQDAAFDQSRLQWKTIPNSWRMYYEGVDCDNVHRILMAHSTDGRTWKKRGVALDVGDGWDAEGVGSPHCVRLDDGSSRMYYTGQSADGKTAIGVAKLTSASGEWTREQASIVFSA
jgi:predicted GH43/DUF377 family glycosyl hydrolase